MAFSPEFGINRALEWNRLLDLAHSETRTVPGKTELLKLQSPEAWAPDIASARLMQQETQEVTPLLDRDALWGPLVDLIDPLASLDRLSRGGVLEVGEWVIMRGWLYAVDSWIQVPKDEIRGELFKKAISRLPDPYTILKILDPVLTPEGELSEKASPKLASLYSEIRSLKREISIVLDQLLKNFSQKGILQENFTDVRDGRYVLPIKISSQNEVEGTIYEASASRQTVFVEPKEVASLNNRLRQRQNDLIQEIFVILEGISIRIKPFISEITEAIEILAHWDSIQGKARLGRHYSGKPIQVTEERYFSLTQTAHPMLWWSLPPESIIRNEIEFGHPARSLLLTGPNTGGKTVLLKTLGLAGICARTGFPFPATDHPTVPFFDTFFADLGDPQSIEHHLSSFSGHVFRFKEILENLTERSLILIDELNSATDPEEGAAFGRAVLETIMSRDAMIVTTTHDPHLKALAVSDQRILNASMEFDESARTPTYRMVLGVPGRSRALETAERLGIPAAVIQLAKKYLSKEHLEFENLLARLESDTQATIQAKKEAISLREEAERLKQEWTVKTETSVQEMMERTQQKLRRILDQAQDEVRASVRKLDEIKNRREIDKTRSTLNETFSQSSTQLEAALTEEAPEIAKILAQKLNPLTKELPAREIQIEVGTNVRVPKWKSTGTILEINGNKIKVTLGKIQVTLSMDEIEILSSSQTSKQGKNQFKTSPSTFETPPQIDLRGDRFDEAMTALALYLDQAYRSGSHVEVTVVHGLGTGVLREGTHKLLKKLPYVKKFRDGGAGHGGAGATLIEFDRD